MYVQWQLLIERKDGGDEGNFFKMKTASAIVVQQGFIHLSFHTSSQNKKRAVEIMVFWQPLPYVFKEWGRGKRELSYVWWWCTSFLFIFYDKWGERAKVRGKFLSSFLSLSPLKNIVGIWRLLPLSHTQSERLGIALIHPSLLLTRNSPFWEKVGRNKESKNGALCTTYYALH